MLGNTTSIANMNKYAEQPSASSGNPLVDTGHGFKAHPLDLTSAEERVYHEVIEESLGMIALSGAERKFKHPTQGDEQTYEHGLRVGSIALGAGIRVGLPVRDLKIGFIGNAVHDIGKLHEDIRPVVHSTERFEDNSSLQERMRDHVYYGYSELSKTRYRETLPRNTRVFAGSHHLFQADREPYGVPVMVEQEKDGYVPDMDTLIRLTAKADPLDGMTVPPGVTGRAYQGEGVKLDKALHVVGKVDAPAELHAAVLDVVDLSAYRRSS